MKLRRNLFDNRGITLMDLLVGLSLLAVAAGGVFAGFKGSLKAWTIAQQYAGEQHNARLVLDWATRRLRMAGSGFAGTPFARAEVDEVVFYGNTDDNPATIECHHIYLNAGQGVVYAHTAQLPTDCNTPDTGGQPLSANVEAQTLAVTALNLQYFDADGVLLPPPLTGAQLTNVHRIQMTIAASGLQFLGPFTLSTQVTRR